MADEYITEPQRPRPVAYDVDVAVAGGGIAGVFAALGAARMGASALLIERFGALGGNMGPGMISQGGLDPDPDDPDFVNTHTKGGMTGIAKEFLVRHSAISGGSRKNLVKSNVASYLALKMMQEEGVQLMLGTYVSDPILDGDRVRGLFVESKSGRQAVKAKVVIDATGEADLARRAGAPVISPGPGYREMDPNHGPYGEGLYYEIAGVDYERYEQAKQTISDEDVQWVEQNIGPISERNRWMAPAMRAAREAGDYADLFADGVFRRQLDGLGEVPILLRLINPDGTASGATSNLRFDWADEKTITRVETHSRMAIFELSQFLKDYVPGFENSHLLCIAPYFGERGGPCIEGEHVVTIDDFKQGRRFDDVVYIYGHVSGGRDVKTGDGKWTDFPYAAMLPKRLDGLIAVGRSASSIPDTLIRGRYKAVHMGQVGGIAAAMAAAADITPKALDVKSFQSALIAAGFYLGDESRLKELALAR